jgi:hypothetical protein
MTESKPSTHSTEATHDETLSTKSSTQCPESTETTIIPQLPNEKTQIKTPEIEWLDLTFDTPIPTIPHSSSSSSRTNLPPCPSLTAYTNPFNWPPARKRFTTYLACSVNAIAAWASGAYASPEQQLLTKWGISHVVYNIGIAIFTTGFAIAPMLLAPLSEINGRRPVFIFAGVLFVLCTLFCGITDSFGGMLAARFFLGVGGSTFVSQPCDTTLCLDMTE